MLVLAASPALAAVAVAPGVERVAAGMGYDNEGSVRLFDASALVPAAVLPGHRTTTNDVAFSPDGALLATGGGTDTSRTVTAVR